MISVGLLLILVAPVRAQIAPSLPAAPAPVGQVTTENLDEIFARFASGRPMIPTLKEIRDAQLKRDLSSRPDAVTSDAPAPSSALASRGAPTLSIERRTTQESVDVAVSRPLPRLELGVGVSQRDTEIGNLHQDGAQSNYAFARIDLSKSPLARKLFHSPTAVHSQSQIGDKVLVQSDDYTTDFLKHPH